MEEQEEQKHQMKQSADAYNHGIKDGLRMAKVTAQAMFELQNNGDTEI